MKGPIISEMSILSYLLKNFSRIIEVKIREWNSETAWEVGRYLLNKLCDYFIKFFSRVLFSFFSFLSIFISNVGISNISPTFEKIYCEPEVKNFTTICEIRIANIVS